MVDRVDSRGRRCALLLRFGDDGGLVPKDAEKWARSIAREWGTINEQKKVRASGLPGPTWWFSCAGHGGYIMVASMFDVPESLLRFAADGVPTWDPDWVESYGGPYRGIAVFRFEEDCDWAVFEVVYPDVARWSVYEREQEWAKNPVFYEHDGTETLLDPKRVELARQRLESPAEMDRLVGERIKQAESCIQAQEWLDAAKEALLVCSCQSR